MSVFIKGLHTMKAGSKAGLTLVEVMVACTMLGLTLCGFFTSFVMQQKAVEFANEKRQALHDARAIIEDLMAANYANADLTVGTHNFTNGIYKGFYVVTESNSMKEIALTTQWKNPGQTMTQSVTLVTSISYAAHH